MCPLACHAVSGDCCCPWPVADVTELSLAGTLAERLRKGTGKTNQTSPRLQIVANHRSNTCFPYWDFTEVLEGMGFLFIFL